MTKFSLRASRVLVVTVIAAALTVSACGKKGDPVAPGQEKKEQKKTS